MEWSSSNALSAINLREIYSALAKATVSGLVHSRRVAVRCAFQLFLALVRFLFSDRL